MQFNRITITTFQREPSKKIIGGYEDIIIKTFKNNRIATINAEKSFSGDNQMWILDEKGINMILSIIDVRLEGVYADFMRFVGYLNTPIGNIKVNTKIHINIWN